VEVLTILLDDPAPCTLLTPRSACRLLPPSCTLELWLVLPTPPRPPAEAEGHQWPAVWKALPTASAVSPVLDHSCWTYFLGEVDWCSTGCTASWCHRFCSIQNLAISAHLRASHHRVPSLFRVLNEICDDRRQEKCGLISTLAIALFRASGFTVIPFRKFRTQQKPHLLRR